MAKSKTKYCVYLAHNTMGKLYLGKSKLSQCVECVSQAEAVDIYMFNSHKEAQNTIQILAHKGHWFIEEYRVENFPMIQNEGNSSQDILQNNTEEEKSKEEKSEENNYEVSRIQNKKRRNFGC